MQNVYQWIGIFGICMLSMSGTLIAEAADSVPKPPGLGDPGELESLTLETPTADPGHLRLAGRDARIQLLVTGEYSTKQRRDLTRDVTYHASPADIVEVAVIAAAM